MKDHDWTTTVATIIATALLNGLIVAFIFGKLDQRVTTLEQLRIEQREEIKASLDEIKSSLKVLFEKVNAIAERK